MIIFWIISALLLLIAATFVVVPLWRSSSKNNSVQRDHANLEIFRDQIAEMDTDLRNGLLTQEMYEQGKRELQSRLLEEVAETKNLAAVVTRNPHKLLALVLAVMLPLLAIGLYWKVGNYPAMLQPEAMAGDSRFEHTISDATLKGLEEKVAALPDDVDKLLLLARSYAERERFADAAQAYERVTRIVPNEAQLWADYADVLAMASGRTLQGTPTALLNKALALDGDNFKALALAGSAAMERADYAATVRHWEKLLKMIPADDENAKMVANGIQNARVLMAQKNGGKPAGQARSAPEEQTQPASGGKEAISGTVVLSDELKSRANPEDTLFVLVRPAQGSKMPLAIVRKQVKDLPLKFTLDDSTAMTPQMKLSNYDQVVVIARISKSGNAMAQAGDLQGMSDTLKPGSKGVKLRIDKIAP